MALACYHPLDLFRKKDGRLAGSPPPGEVPRPITIACGQCYGCRLERSRQWAVRCVHEAKMHDANSFVTLTYDDAHLPEHGSLVLRHWQDFARRLRRHVGPFRFYHCGEYGDVSWRPHYHALIFGLDFSADRKLLTTTPRGDRLYTSALLDSIWGHGYTNIGAVTRQSASYVARYCMKKINGDKATQHYQRVDTETGEIFQLKPEYATMSRRPGIGKTWLEKYHTDVYPSDSVVIDGHHTRPPKYYDTQQSDELLEQIKADRKAKALPHRANNTRERLAVRETVKRAQLTQLKREAV